MRNFVKYLAVAAAFALAFVSATPPASEAQGVNVQGVLIQPFKAKTAVGVVTAVHTVNAVYVKYVGPVFTTAATVSVSATGDATFTVSGAADVTVNASGNCGATPGVLDMSTPLGTCDTIGKAVNAINESANWVAVIQDALASDSDDNAFKDDGAINAATPQGAVLHQETTTGLTITVGLHSAYYAPGILEQFNSPLGRGLARLNSNPYEGQNQTLLYALENITTTDNAANLVKVYCVQPNYSVKKAYSETVTQLFQKAAAATTVNGILNEFVNSGGLTCNEGKLLVRVNGNTTLTAPTVIATGYTSRINP